MSKDVGARVVSRYFTVAGREVLDEVVATGAHVHLEQITDSEFCLIVQSGNERVWYSIGAARAAVRIVEVERDITVNRKSEAAKVRESRKRAVAGASSFLPAGEQ